MGSYDLYDNEKNVCCVCGDEVQPPKIGIVINRTGQVFCEDCIRACSRLIAPACRVTSDGAGIPAPAEIKAELDKSIIGQEGAKTDIAVAVYNHYKRMRMGSQTKIGKSNMLLIGPTGCGKTLIAKTVAGMLDVPFVVADCTSLTEAGYIGDDVESVLAKLYIAAGHDIEKTERGIVFLDEIDKLAFSPVGASVSKDPSGLGVQQCLLKLIEGTVANVPVGGGRKVPAAETVQINTENILFICGGAFQGLEEVLEKKKKGGALGIGFGADVSKKGKAKNMFQDTEPEDLVKYGMMPELVGRLPVIVSLEELDEADLVDVLTKPKDSIVKQYQELFRFDNVELEFTEAALKEIAREAARKKTGARGLRGIMERVLKEPMFKVPSMPGVRRCIVDEGGKTMFLKTQKRRKRTAKAGQAVKAVKAGQDGISAGIC